jgi:hypothetical protein
MDEPDLDPEELDEELDDPEIDGELDEDLEDLDGEVPLEADDDDDEVAAVDGEEEAEEEAVPAARKRPRSGEEEDDDEDIDPDDVEADLDTILKDRIASGDDEDEEDEVEDVTGDPGDRVAAKGADEFVCPTCFLIVHPRQFGRLGKLSCPEGYDPCGAITKVEAQLKKARRAPAG